MARLPENLECWKCGSPITDTPFPLARTSTCGTCDAELHVCKLCAFYDISVANQCRETIADPIVEKERANFCGYFSPKPQAYVARKSDDVARAQLDALFGETAYEASEKNPQKSPEDIAREKLEDLFKK